MGIIKQITDNYIGSLKPKSPVFKILFDIEINATSRIKPFISFRQGMIPGKYSLFV